MTDIQQLLEDEDDFFGEIECAEEHIRAGEEVEAWEKVKRDAEDLLSVVQAKLELERSRK